MALGKRIDDRLKELEWPRAALLDRVPGLSAQALSNLIRRDSKRSEWDTLIAQALGVSVSWLVYGTEDAHAIKEPDPLPYGGRRISAEEADLLAAFQRANAQTRAALLLLSKSINPPDEINLDERTGT